MCGTLNELYPGIEIVYKGGDWELSILSVASRVIKVWRYKEVEADRGVGIFQFF